MKANEQFTMLGKLYTATKLFSSETINVKGLQYQRWYFKDEKGHEYMDWIKVGEAVARVGYRKPRVRETEKRIIN